MGGVGLVAVVVIGSGLGGVTRKRIKIHPQAPGVKVTVFRSKTLPPPGAAASSRDEGRMWPGSFSIYSLHGGDRVAKTGLAIASPGVFNDKGASVP